MFTWQFTLVNASQNCILFGHTVVYRTVKNFGGQKVWRKGHCKALAEKTLAKKHVSFPCNQLEISATLPFRQVSKRIANESDFSLSRNCPRNKHRCINSVLPLVAISRLIHRESHDPWLSV